MEAPGRSGDCRSVSSMRLQGKFESVVNFVAIIVLELIY